MRTCAWQTYSEMIEDHDAADIGLCNAAADTFILGDGTDGALTFTDSAMAIVCHTVCRASLYDTVQCWPQSTLCVDYH